MDIFAALPFLSPESIITSGGIALIAFIVFAESGLAVGFFLPGDTLLFAAGFFASQGLLPIQWLIPAIVISAIIGDNVGYTIGRRLGPRLFKKEDGVFFKTEYVERAERFYEKHGGKTIILARFTPIVRTFAPMIAGVAKMDRKKFLTYNIIGALLWGVGVTLLGYYFGNLIPNIDAIILPVIGLVVFLSILPTIIHIAREPKARAIISSKIKRLLRLLTLNKIR